MTCTRLPGEVPRRGRAAGIWAFFAVLLAAEVPLFLCQHLTSDTVLYDLQARCALEGGVLYRDILEPNFPGVVWLHMLVRSLLGWSWPALRGVDLLMVAGVVLLLDSWINRSLGSHSSLRTASLFVALFGLYFSLSEWCHCQRDLWMLLPCLGALHLRCRQVLMRRASPACPLPSTGSGWSALLTSLAEGALWGIAFWIKPHIAVPAILVLGVSLILTGCQRGVWLDLAGVLAGGVLVGLAGSAWLIWSGAWPYFWEMQLEWNPEYLRAGRQKTSLSRLCSFWDAFSPWSWGHVAALGTIAVLIYRFCTRPGTAGSEKRLPLADADVCLVLLCTLYLGWMLQVLTLQHPLAYVHVPGLFLSLAIVVSWRIPSRHQHVCWLAWPALGALALTVSPLAQPARLSAWWDCLTRGPTAAVRSRIQVELQPDWKELEPILSYLRRQDLHDGELNAYSGGLVQLYPELGLRPPTRFVYVNVLAILFQSRTAEIQRALQQSPQRLVVSSLREAGMTPARIADADDPETGLPISFPRERLAEFPFNQPVVFRSGQYVVHQVSRPVGKLCTESGPLACPLGDPRPVSLENRREIDGGGTKARRVAVRPAQDSAAD